MNTELLTRTEVEIQHHRDMHDFYYELFNRLSPKCVKRRARAQAKFNFHRTRMIDLYMIQKKNTN